MSRSGTSLFSEATTSDEVHGLVQAGFALDAVVLRLVAEEEVDEEAKLLHGPETAVEPLAGEDGLEPQERVGDLVGREQLAVDGVHDLLRVALPEPGLALPSPLDHPGRRDQRGEPDHARLPRPQQPRNKGDQTDVPL